VVGGLIKKSDSPEVSLISTRQVAEDRLRITAVGPGQRSHAERWSFLFRMRMGVGAFVSGGSFTLMAPASCAAPHDSSLHVAILDSCGVPIMLAGLPWTFVDGSQCLEFV